MTEAPKHEEISALRVSKLFGRFDHCLKFPEFNEISIITAPNGYGKTVVLRIIDSLFNQRLHFFAEIDFNEIEVSFRSKKSITISKTKDDDARSDTGHVVVFKPRGFGAEQEDYTLDEDFSPSDIRYIERNFPVERLDENRWMDLMSDRVLTIQGIYTEYRDHLPRRIKRSIAIPDWLQNASESVNAHLVETQRLLSMDEREDHLGSRRRRRIPSSVVEKDAEDLANRIGKLLQDYANEAQKLDQTFPKRILQNRRKRVSSVDKIRDDLTGLTRRQDELISVGLSEVSRSQPIKPSEIPQEENIRAILEVYVEDTSKKLSIFDETYGKIRLFKELLETRFSFKSIAIDSSRGIKAIDTSSEQAIPLSELSSGEQHELVLIYELLFSVEEGSLILIDEPELSLHVLWQRKFIEDLQRIQKIKNLRVLIATHSPQIINDKWDLVQELKS